jgi:hypothetical protein
MRVKGQWRARLTLQPISAQWTHSFSNVSRMIFCIDALPSGLQSWRSFDAGVQSSVSGENQKSEYWHRIEAPASFNNNGEQSTGQRSRVRTQILATYAVYLAWGCRGR